MGGMSLWQALVLGLVQGLTEFIPVSSTAHLRIVPAVLGWPDPGTAFSAVIQLGTLAAVLLYFQRDLRRLLSAGVRSLWRADVRAGQDAGLAWAIVAGNVPIVVLGLTFRGQIETQARSLPLIAGMLIAVALLLALAERRAPRRLGMEALRLRQVLAIGLWQALALIPGTSRSGATILGGLLAGLRREDAARFSFLLGVPAILGSGLLELHGLLTYGGGSVAAVLAAVPALSGALSGRHCCSGWRSRRSAATRPSAFCCASCARTARRRSSCIGSCWGAWCCSCGRGAWCVEAPRQSQEERRGCRRGVRWRRSRVLLGCQ